MTIQAPLIVGLSIPFAALVTFARPDGPDVSRDEHFTVLEYHIPQSVRTLALSPADHALPLADATRRVRESALLPVGQRKALRRSREEKRSNRRMTVLVVDDSEQVRQVISRALEHAGYKVLSVGSGPEALRVLDFGSGQIDLLITDMHLPAGMNGAELALEVHVRKPQMPVLYISGVYQESGPVQNYLVKPFSMRLLVAKVAEILTDVE